MSLVASRPEYFGCLIDRYEDKLRRYVRRIVPSLSGEEDDVLQEVFIKAFVNSQGFDTSLSFSSWIYRITHNEAVNWLRKKSTRPVLVELGDEEVEFFKESIEQAFDVHERKLTKDEVKRVLSEMPYKYRSVLVLHFLEGKRYEEIGDILTIPIGTVGTLIHRAKIHFKSKFTIQYGAKI